MGRGSSQTAARRDGRGHQSNLVASDAARMGQKKDPPTHWCTPWATLAVPIGHSGADEALSYITHLPILDPARQEGEMFDQFLGLARGLEPGIGSARGEPRSAVGGVTGVFS